MERDLKFVTLGAGFWAGVQLAGWQEAGGARCVGICDRDRAKAEALAKRFGIPAVHEDPAELLRSVACDAVDILTSNASHEEMVRLAADHGRDVICQKPMAVSGAAAR